MEDLLLLKYPSLREKIQAARGNGLSDEEIERKIERTIERKLASGWTMDRLSARLGQTPEARLAFREASRLNAMETVSDAYELPYGKARAVVETSEREGIPIPSVVGIQDAFGQRLHERETTEWHRPIAKLNLKGEDILARMASGIVVGAMGSVRGLFDSAEWLTGWQKARQVADGIDEASRSLTAEILGGRKGNVFDGVVQGIGSTAVFLVPGIAAASLASKGGASASRAVRFLSAIAGASAMSVTESLTEAGSVYRTAMERTGSETAASAAASWTFWTNLPTNFLSDKVAFFSELPGFERLIGKFVPAKWAPVVAQAVKGGVSEPTQEIMQGAISQHYGEGVPWSALDLSEIAYREGLPAAVVGALFGVGMGQEAREVREKETREREVRKSAERVREKAREVLAETGRPEEEIDSAAALVAAYAMTASEREGITPEEWFEGKGLEVAEQEATEGLVLNQFIGKEGIAELNMDVWMAQADAKIMAGEGKSPEEIKEKTGFHQGADGKWRYEISDADAKLVGAEDGMSTREWLTGLRGKLGKEILTLEDVLDHPNLFRAYPGLRQVEVDFDALHENANITAGGITLGEVLSTKSAMNSLMHEIQHAIQVREGHASGGASGVMAWTDPRLRKALMDELAKNPAPQPAPYRLFWGSDEHTKESDKAYADYLKYFKKEMGSKISSRALQEAAGHKVYEKLAGEIEARDTSSRLNLTDEARRRVMPNVPEDAIVVYNGQEWGLFKQGKRGQIALSSGKAILKTFASADASTLVHELGHLFLEDLDRAMGSGKLSKRAEKDYRTLREWLQAEEGKPLTREQHEKFARGFEVYLREGRAPSLALRSVFERFRKWLTKIYARAESLNVELTDDIRGVFDRLLAFEPDIEVARRVEAAEREDAAMEVRFPDWLKPDEDENDDALDRLEQALEGNAEALASIVDEEPPAGKTRQELLEDALEEARRAVLSAVPKAEGTGKVGDFVREWAALLELREEIRANRKGTPALKYSAALKAIRERLSENSRLRQEAVGLLRSIKRSASGKISARAREEIREKLGKYDLSAIRDESGRQEMRQQFEQYLADEPNPDPKVEEEAEGLSAVAAGEMTLSDLYALLQEVKGVARVGREEYQLWEQERSERLGAIRSELEKTLPDRIEAVPVTSRSLKAGGGVRKGVLGLQAKTLRPARLFRILDGHRTDGPWTDLAMRRARKCRDAFLRQKDRRMAWLKSAMKEHGIEWGELGRVRLRTKNEAGQDISLTLEECMHAYAAYGNWLNRVALRYGNGLGKSVLLEAIGALSQNERAFADAILKEEESHFDRINGVLERVFQIRMEKVDNHISMFRLRGSSAGKSADNAIAEHVNTIAKLSSMKRTIMRRGFAEARKILGPEMQAPIQTGLVSVWLRTMTTTEYTAAFAEHATAMQEVLNQGYSGSQSLLLKIEDRYGRGFAEAIKNWANTITMPDFYRAFTSMDDLLRKVRANSGIARMAFNLLSASKQLVSFVLLVGYAGPVHMASAIAQFAADPKGTCEFVWSRDPHVKEQAVDRLLEELKLSGAEGANLYRHKVASAGFAPMLWLDMAVRAVGWKAVYDRMTANGLSEDEAIAVAQDAILATQNAADPEELPLYMKGGELMNLVTQFTNQANQIYNITFYDIPADFLSGHSGKAFGGIVGLTLSAILVGILNNGELPEDPGDLIQWVLQEELGSLPLIGNAIAATLAGYRSSGTAIDSMGSALAKIGKEAAEGDIEKALMATGEFAALAVGLPFVGLKRLWRAVESGDIGALLGWDR